MITTNTTTIRLRRRSRTVFEVVLDIHATNGTALIGREPLIDAFHVEQVHAGQPPVHHKH